MKPKMIRKILVLLICAGFIFSCGNGGGKEDFEVEIEQEEVLDEGEIQVDVFSDENIEEITEMPEDGSDQQDGGDSIEMDGLNPNATIEVLNVRLPMRLGGIAAATDGDVAWIFGGVNGPPPQNVVDTIIRFDPVANEAITLQVKLPEPTFIHSADWGGSAVFIFGGYAGSSLTNAILRFDPAGGSVEKVGAVLPEPLGRTASAFDGEVFMIFGGNTGGFAPSGFSSMVASYNFNNDTLLVSTATLPSPRASRIGAIYCGGRTLLFGGWGAAGKLDEILEYDKTSDSVSLITTRLPTGMDGAALACDGRYVYIFGGESNTETLDMIVRFDTATSELIIMDVTLPQPLRGHAGVWINGSAYIFGGNTGSGLTDAILKFTPM